MENKEDFQKEGKEDILLENSSKNSISSKKKKRPRKKNTENATSAENKLLLDNHSHQQSIAGSIPIESRHENDESAIDVDEQTANDAAHQCGEKNEAAKNKKKRKPRKRKSKIPASFPEINDVQNSKDSICQGCNEHNNGESVAIECVTTIHAPIAFESDEKKSTMVCKIDNEIHGHMDLTSFVSLINEQDVSEYVIDESTLEENGQNFNDPHIREGIVQSDAGLATMESEEIINAPLVFRSNDENSYIPITLKVSDGQLSHEVINQTSVGFATVDTEEKDCENFQEDKDIATYDNSDVIFGDSIGYVEMKEGGGQVIYNDNEQSYSEKASQHVRFENSIVTENSCLVTSESESHLSDLIINEDKQFDDNQTNEIVSQNFRFGESVTCEESDKNRDDRVIYESVEQESYDAVVYNSKEEICSSVSYDQVLCDSTDLVSENSIVTDKNCDLIISNSSEHCHELMTIEFNEGLIVHEISKLRGCCENLEGDDDKFCDKPVSNEFHELDDRDPIVSRSKKRVDDDNKHHDSNGQNDAYTVVFKNHEVTLKSNKQSEEVPVNTSENSNSEETTSDCEAATCKHVEQNRELGDFPLIIAMSKQNYCCNEIAIPYESDSKPCHQSANHEFDEQNDADLVASKSEKREIEDHRHCNRNDHEEDGIPVISERDEQISSEDSYCENILENDCDAVEQHFDQKRELSDFPLVVRSEVEYQDPVLASEHNQDGSPEGNRQHILNEATPEQDEQKDSDVVAPLYEEQKDSNVVAPVYDEQSNDVSCDNKLAIEIGNSTRPKFSSSFVTIRKSVQRYQELTKQSLKRTSSGTLMPLKRRKSEMKPKSKGLFEMFAGLQVFCFLLACHAICVLLSVLKRNLLRSN